MIICVFTGLLTPVGDTPYTYLYKIMKGNTTQSISEHLPLTLINNKEIMVVLTAILALLIFTDTKIRLKDLFMLAGLTLLMFMTRRQESMLVLFGSAIVAKMITQWFEKYDSSGLKQFEKIMVSTLGVATTILLVILISIVEIKPKINDKFINPNSYPVAAAEYIKENLDLNTYGKSHGRNGNYSTNYQQTGRDLMTPDEVRMLDNKYAILFIRGERPIKDLKYDILKHPNISLTTDGHAPSYEHGKVNNAIATITVDYDAINYDFKEFRSEEGINRESQYFIVAWSLTS